MHNLFSQDFLYSILCVRSFVRLYLQLLSAKMNSISIMLTLGQQDVDLEGAGPTPCNTAYNFVISRIFR